MRSSKVCVEINSSLLELVNSRMQNSVNLTQSNFFPKFPVYII